ncbi:hypothetical protein P875_00076265 [Aspergillus parasiticus SU-1]|uniref:Uncharacterized protein n=1 Tax=Aspergillus parasiticus (strain ATCC 56775 / NRRL 5862 / SRRC 143 / SU-1) TaxID=1403190 RepID=A0A0F0IQW1_ASPPU|nr:hypothetical protein P875_00076265 [Aspergillus parasiticus SU-1]
MAMRQCFHAIWQLFPITVQAPFRLFEKCAYPPVQPRPQQREEAKRHSTKNLRYIRSMYLALALVVGLIIDTRRSLPEESYTASLALPGLQGISADGVATILKYDEAIAMASGFVWLE